jgi:hypothetical protein
MVDHRLIVSTDVENLQRVAIAGRPVLDLYPQINDVLRSRLSAAHARLFALPVADSAGARAAIEWYTEYDGEITPFASLSESERAERATPVLRMAREILSLAEDLTSRKEEDGRPLAEMLKAALTTPGLDHLYLIGDSAVLTNWGMQPAGASAQSVDLVYLLREAVDKRPQPTPPSSPSPLATETAQRAAGVSSAPAAEPRIAPAATATPAGSSYPFTTRFVTSPPARKAAASVWRWPLILLCVFALGLTGWRLLRNCALGTPFGLGLFDSLFVSYCSGRTGGPEMSRGADETAGLLARLDASERRYTTALRNCPANCAVPTPTQTPQRHTQLSPPATQTPTPTPNPICDDLRRNNRTVGAANVVLKWDTTDDLDVHVVCPTGEHIYYAKQNVCGANLMSDVNVRGESAPTPTDHPIEDVRFSDASPNGEYKVYVDRFSGAESGQTAYTVTLLVNGAVVQSKAGVATKLSLSSPTLDDVIAGRPVMTFTLPQQTHTEVPPECRASPAPAPE